MKNIQIAGLTDVGRARTQNEDNLIEFDSPNGYVVAVCDGMGGENGGATASDLAVTIIKDILTNNTFSAIHEIGLVSFVPLPSTVRIFLSDASM